MRTKICLNAISGNEINNIKNCLDNHSHIIDAVVIDCNGTGDGTMEYIINWCKEHKIPCGVRYVPWVKDFGHSRTLAIRAAEHFLGFKVSKAEVTASEESEIKKLIALNTEYSTIPDLPQIDTKDFISADTRWYLMFADIDNDIRKYKDEQGHKDNKGPVFEVNKANLNGDLITIDMNAAGIATFTYNWMVKLDHSGTRRWRWYYPVHEHVGYVNESQAPISQHIKGGYIFSGRTGARNQDPLKYLNDAVSLEKFLVSKPQDPRALYYCAQSYRDAGKYHEALAFFDRRGKVDGWIQEKYVAMLEAGKICQMLYPKNPWRSLEFFYKALELKLPRHEAAYHIIKFYRDIGLFNAGWEIARNYVDLEYPKGALLIDDSIYEWKFNDLASLCAFYAGNKNKGKELTKRALKSNSIPLSEKERMTKNLEWYR